MKALDLMAHRSRRAGPAGSKREALEIVASARLPTESGGFRLFAFGNARDGKEHIALVKGDVAGKQRVLVRMHSECLTGDALGSLRCDCRPQLQGALEKINAEGRGVLLYLRQEGRGIGLTNKIRAYELQDNGLDTVEANETLGFPYDARDYDVPGEMLKLLKVKSVCLLTNNPEKVKALKARGVKVASRSPLEIPPNPFNKKYLDAKRKKLGHFLHI